MDCYWGGQYPSFGHILTRAQYTPDSIYLKGDYRVQGVGLEYKEYMDPKSK